MHKVIKFKEMKFIDEISAGPEMDQHVAIEVMGRKLPTRETAEAIADEVWKTQPSCGVFHEGFEAYRDKDGNFHYRCITKDFSTNETAMGEVIKQLSMPRRYWTFVQTERGWIAVLSGISSGADTLPLAVCRTALKVSVGEAYIPVNQI